MGGEVEGGEGDAGGIAVGDHDPGAGRRRPPASEADAHEAGTGTELHSTSGEGEGVEEGRGEEEGEGDGGGVDGRAEPEVGSS